jgi:TolB-like protein
VSKLFYELKRRNVIKIGAAYLIAAWVLLQITDVLVPILLLPVWVPRLVFLLLAIGFIPALIFAWAYELTPEGIKPEKDVDPDESITDKTGRRLNFLIFGALALAIAFLLFDKYGRGEPSAGETLPPTIAVMPFDAMSSNTDDEHFADGLTEELLNSLAKISELQVVGRTSSFYYKDKPQDLREIGAALDVAHVLEGSVRRDGNTLRITAQLVRTDNGFHLWTETYDRSADQIFAIQEEISEEVANQLHVRILGQEQAALQDHGTTNADAHARFLIANSYVRRGKAFGLDGSQELGDLQTARRLLEEAVELDPEFALAWARLAVVYHHLKGAGLQDAAGNIIDAADAARLADNAVKKSVELAPESPETWAAKGFHLAEEYHAMLLIEPDLLTEIVSAFEKALELEPDNISALELYADFETTQARHEKALELYDRALAVDPLSTVRLRRARAMYLAGNAAEAWAEYLDIRQLYPEAPVLRGIAEIEFDRGHLHHGMTLVRDELGSTHAIYALASLGDIEGSDAVLAFFESMGGDFINAVTAARFLINRDYKGLADHNFSHPRFDFTVLWLSWAFLRDWESLVARQPDALSSPQPFRTYFHMTTQPGDDPGGWNAALGVYASGSVYFAHALSQVGRHEEAAALRQWSMRLAEMIPQTVPRRIQERHHVRLYNFASQGDTEAALTEFEAMVEAGWRWTMSAAMFDWIDVYGVERAWLEDSPLLDSIRDEPRFIAALDKVKADNARMLAELEAGISIDSILEEGVR